MLPGLGETVHLAVITGGFVGFKWASIQSTSCVSQKTITVFAYLVTGSMLVRTIDTHHRFDGAFLPLYSACWETVFAVPISRFRFLSIIH